MFLNILDNSRKDNNKIFRNGNNTSNNQTKHIIYKPQ